MLVRERLNRAFDIEGLKYMFFVSCEVVGWVWEEKGVFMESLVQIEGRQGYYASSRNETNF